LWLHGGHNFRGFCDFLEQKIIRIEGMNIKFQNMLNQIPGLFHVPNLARQCNCTFFAVCVSPTVLKMMKPDAGKF
jgi:hypothetical protein